MGDKCPHGRSKLFCCICNYGEEEERTEDLETEELMKGKEREENNNVQWNNN